jgi:simple sugar transport system permease protein
MTAGSRARAALLSTVAALAAAQVVFALLVYAYGESPASVFADLLHGTWGTAYGAGQVLFKATPLLFTGVAFDVALRAGLFNIGAEGQLTVASLAVAVVGARLAPSTPAVIALPIIVAVAAGAGACWAVPPAVLRARFGAHEVISTIMMNRIADALVGYGLATGLAQAGTVRTPDVAAGARVPRLETVVGALHGSAASFALPFAAGVAALSAVWLARARAGREIVLVGMNPVACRAEGIPVRTRVAQALVVSGAVAGLASTATVLGYKGYFESGLGAGAGFGGLAVAILGRGNVVGMILAALLFGTLAQGGLAINGRVPMEITDLLQGVVIVAVAFADERVRAAVARAVPGIGRRRAQEATT